MHDAEARVQRADNYPLAIPDARSDRIHGLRTVWPAAPPMIPTLWPKSAGHNAFYDIPMVTFYSERTVSIGAWRTSILPP